jgi:hypothetical protein
MTPSAYTIRRLRPEDAAGVTACVRRVYGETYICHKELYDPEKILRLNQTGQLVSFVAVDGAGQVVGHYALERPDLGRVAETGEAMVLPEHQHHHLLERMRVALVEEARRLGLAGLFGQPVTNHVFSQKMYEHTPGHPCGVSLGDLPRTFHNLAEPLTQRLSCLLYFHYLQLPPAVVIHAPSRHLLMLRRIYEQFCLPLDLREPGAVPARGTLTVTHEPEEQAGLVRVRTAGADTAEAIRTAHRELRALGAEVVFLELPLAQPGTPGLCAAAEAMGFFFCGVGPYHTPDGDVLRLQCLHVELDVALLQVANPFAGELVAYVAAERMRTMSSAADV